VASRLQEQRKDDGVSKEPADVKSALTTGEAAIAAAADERTMKWEFVLLRASSMRCRSRLSVADG
jgi:hypothetical protein